MTNDLYMNDATRKHRKKHGAVQSVDIESIKVGSRMRPAGNVTRLKNSIAADGLRTPISVMITYAEDGTGKMELMAGARRLKACKALGWTDIPAFVYIKEDGDTTEARLWEIVENLQREELTTEQKDAHIAAYAELVKVRAAEQRKAGELKGKINVAKTVAADLGVSPRTVERALKPGARAKENAAKREGENRHGGGPATPAPIPGHTSSKTRTAGADVQKDKVVIDPLHTHMDEGNTEDGYTEEGTEGPTVTKFAEAAAKLAAKQAAKGKPESKPRTAETCLEAWTEFFAKQVRARGQEPNMLHMQSVAQGFILNLAKTPMKGAWPDELFAKAA